LDLFWQTDIKKHPFYMCSVYVHGSKSSMKIKRTRAFARSLPWILSPFSLGKCLDIKALEWNIFTIFFSFYHCTTGRKIFCDRFSFFTLLFRRFRFIFYFLFSIVGSWWFPLKTFLSHPSMIRYESEKSWTLAKEVFFLTPISSLVWVKLFFPIVFDNACA